MREIRLRAKRREKATMPWLYGGTDPMFAPFFHVQEGVWTHHAKEGSYCHVCKGTLTESTGLRDRNGAEIFEGDILEYWDTETNGDLTSHLVRKCGEVKRHKFGEWMTGDDSLGYFLEQGIGELQMHLGIEDDCDSNGVPLSECTGVKVIGNVFDNPELLMNNENGNADRSND